MADAPIDPTSYDVVVVGTGLPEALVARCAAGKNGDRPMGGELPRSRVSPLFGAAPPLPFTYA